jgi:hypothetical protein
MKKTNPQTSMKNSSTDWDLIRDQEILLLQAMTVRESLRHYQDLLTNFEWQLQLTSDLFSADRRQALIDLQNRLQRYALWQIHDAKSVPINPKDSEPSV